MLAVFSTCAATFNHGFGLGFVCWTSGDKVTAGVYAQLYETVYEHTWVCAHGENEVGMETLGEKEEKSILTNL